MILFVWGLEEEEEEEGEEGEGSIRLEEVGGGDDSSHEVKSCSREEEVVRVE